MLVNTATSTEVVAGADGWGAVSDSLAGIQVGYLGLQPNKTELNAYYDMKIEWIGLSNYTKNGIMQEETCPRFIFKKMTIFKSLVKRFINLIFQEETQGFYERGIQVYKHSSKESYFFNKDLDS